MLAHVKHPVPVRFKTPRGIERVAYQALRTPVQIPEVSAVDMDRTVLAFDTVLAPDSGPLKGRTLRIHDDRIWDVVTVGHLGLDADNRRAPATVEQFLAALAGDAEDPWGPLSGGTPLVSPSDDEGDIRGRDLPGSVLRQAEDLSMLARQALFEHVGRTLVTDGTRVFTARGAPAIMTMNVNKPFEVIPWSRPTLYNGVAFEIAHLRALPEFVRDTKVDPGMLVAAAKLARDFKSFPHVGNDLRAFVNDAPEQLMRLSKSAAYKEPQLTGRTNPARAPARAQAMAIAPWADLGSIGAIPRERWAEVVGLVSDAFAALRETLDGATEPALAKQISAYARLVAMPELRPVAAEEDVAAIAPLTA